MKSHFTRHECVVFAAERIQNVSDVNGEAPLHIACSWDAAAPLNPIRIAKLVEEGADVNEPGRVRDLLA